MCVWFINQRKDAQALNLDWILCFFPVSLTGVCREEGYVVILVKQWIIIILSSSMSEHILLILKENIVSGISQQSISCGVMQWLKVSQYVDAFSVRIAVVLPFHMSDNSSVKAAYSKGEDLQDKIWLCFFAVLLVFWICACFCTKLLIFLTPCSGTCESCVPSAAFCVASVLSGDFWGKQVALFCVRMLGDLGLERIDCSCSDRI